MWKTQQQQIKIQAQKQAEAKNIRIISFRDIAWWDSNPKSVHKPEFLTKWDILRKKRTLIYQQHVLQQKQMAIKASNVVAASSKPITGV